MKIKVLLEYVASFMFLLGLVLVGGGLAFLTCNLAFNSGFFFAVMLVVGAVLTLSGKGLAWVVCGGENEYE